MGTERTIEDKVVAAFRIAFEQRRSAVNWRMSGKVALESDMDGNLYLYYDGVWIARMFADTFVLQMQDPHIPGAEGAVFSLLQAVCLACFLPPIEREDGIWTVRLPGKEPRPFGSLSDEGTLEVFPLQGGRKSSGA